MQTRVLFLLLFPLSLIGQTLKLQDAQTQQPVSDALVWQSDVRDYSDAAGQVALTEFSRGEPIMVQHPSYEEKLLTWAMLENSNFRVSLREKAVQTEEVVVSASRWAEPLTEVAAQVVRLSPETISDYQPQTTADLLSRSGKVYVQKSQLGGGSPMLRGFAANSVLLVVDGVRMNNAIFRGGNLQNIILLDANTLERAEVVLGPGSVLFGSDALGGVMHFRTQNPSAEAGVSGDYLLRYATANHEKTAHAQVNYGLGKFGFLTAVTFSDFDDLRTGSWRPNYPTFGIRPEYVIRRDGEDVIVPNEDENVQRFSGYQQLNLLQKIRWRNWQYSLQFSTSSDVPRYDRLIEYRNGAPRNAEWYYGPQNWLMHSLRYQHTRESLLWDEFRLRVAHQRVDEDRIDRRFQDVRRRRREEDVNVLSLNWDVQKTWSEKTRLFYGAEWVFNDVQSSGTRTDITTGISRPTATRYPEGGSQLTNAAVYALLKHDLTERWLLSVGGRFTMNWLEADFGTSDFYDFPFRQVSLQNQAPSGALGLSRKLKNYGQIWVQASTGFRAPNVDDVGKFFDSEPGNVVVPNPDLNPEHTLTTELGWRKTRGWWRGEASVYYTWLRDAIVRRPFTFNGRDSIFYDGQQSAVSALVNAGRGYVWGWQASLEADLAPNLLLRGSLTYTDGRDQTEDIPLRHIPPLFGQLSLSYTREKLEFEVWGQAHTQKRFADLSPSEQNKTHLYTADGTPAWWTLNLRTEYRLAEPLVLRVSLENILDRHYRPFSSGISAPGRNLSVGVSGRF